MRWKNCQTYLDGGTHTVAKIFVKGIARYEAWRKSTQDAAPVLLSANLDTTDEAKTICEQDAAR